MTIRGFGSDENSWNSAEEDPARRDSDGEFPGIGLFGRALQVWSIAQDRGVSVTEASLAFKVTPDLIRQAVEWHPYMYVGANDLIEHDGE